MSRYKLDEYLQLFDFPAPNISAEKRFTTTVPLQRLFLMNSDFMQVEAENWPSAWPPSRTIASRIKKVYLLVYGRDPSEQEIKLGIEYLHTEPMKEYEENKNKPAEDARGRRPRRTRRRRRSRPCADSPTRPKPRMPRRRRGGRRRRPAAPTAHAHGHGNDGRHGRFGGGVGGPAADAAAPDPRSEVKYEPTAWGRYAKVLFSSSEFLFIN